MENIADQEVVAKPEVDLDCEQRSVASELECPVCFQLYCEPVRAGCQRHVFCRNCLIKSQNRGTILRCPICRAESCWDPVDIPEVAELVEGLSRKDPEFRERAVAASREREELLRSWSQRVHESRRLWLPSARGAAPREVGGAGRPEANGIYLPGILATYIGPTVYRKPNSHLFIFRWHQTQWAIAELQNPFNMGNEQEWLYRAPTQYPPDVPPLSGWEVQGHGHSSRPAPEVRIVRGNLVATATTLRNGTSNSGGAAFLGALTSMSLGD
eukprot:CAMPEP_0170609050 /NCGR_PEP_ID=MMETSP0224-20130122/21913_1 /TAXON_ID=285029 /ORGANISM="Togula jolla, Strain CCCM 725" /LENGTH=269 /DNA_ID=CAMNT_0010934321 /DNA_START=50 /DNA_END=860 /DNA_ORIENTATION=-